ncbi:OLC1v1030169C1 [Oldenlandia corymbosa var. corymbosa]|uniref:OLC1v1030169C1 n=1 Tax=Oldenlandia corymbosa var. corymbosa TaxID=529605 RepID=A0AAV1CGZ3_OLDCO|nr:OLC1v1030169C1 [Oldenlandia corymbosa var. corymbosa]
MGNWDASCVDKDEFALKMWDETPEGMDIGVCFKSQSEAKHAVILWNIHHKREYTVAASSPRTWAVRCRTFNVESEDGEPPCEWKMRVSLKAHGLHEFVRWQDAHNCMTPVNDNDNRCVDASLIARLIKRKVEDNIDFTVVVAQKDVKTLLKVDVPYKRVWHGRRKAIEAVYGDWTSNFEELPQYIAALKFTNPETVVEWEWKEGQEEFRRLPPLNPATPSTPSTQSGDPPLLPTTPIPEFPVTPSTFPGGSPNPPGTSFRLSPPPGDSLRLSPPPATSSIPPGDPVKLMVWAYERIEMIAPQRKRVDYLIDETAPLAQRWECRYTYGDAPRSSTPPFRDQLTSLHVEDFQWQPYAHVLHRLPDFLYTRPSHLDDQDVPKRPMIKDNAAFLLDHAHSMSRYPSNNWVDHHSAVRRHWNRREEYVLRDLEEGDPGSIYEGYYEWFMVNTVRLISNPGNYEPQGYETCLSRVKLYGELLNNIRVSTERFREKREDDNLLDEELDKHLDDIINQTHAALTLGANDEMEVEDTQILVDEDPSLLSQPPPGKKAKPWSRDKIGGGRKRKVTIPPRTSQQQTEGQQNKDQAHSSRGSRIQVETHFEDAGGLET